MNMINKFICGDNIQVMRELSDNSIDVIVTSPPYDNIRDYKGFSVNLSETGKEAYRILKTVVLPSLLCRTKQKILGKLLHLLD